MLNFKLRLTKETMCYQWICSNAHPLKENLTLIITFYIYFISPFVFRNGNGSIIN